MLSGYGGGATFSLWEAVHAKHRLEVLYEKFLRRFEAPTPPAQMPGREEGKEPAKRGFRQENEEKNSQGEDPRTFEENNKGRVPSTAEATWRRGGEFRKMEGREVEEEEEKRKEKEKEEGEAQMKEMVGKVQRDHHKSVYDENGGRRKEKGKQKKGKTSQSKTNLREIWEVILSLPDHGTELAKRQRSSRRTTKKNRCSDEDVRRSAEQREQMDGVNPEKVDAAERGRRNGNEERGKTEKRYTRIYKGKCDFFFFGTEHRLRREEMEEQFNRLDAERITDVRAVVKTESTRQEDSMLQSTATWEQLWEQKKGRLSRS